MANHNPPSTENHAQEHAHDHHEDHAHADEHHDDHGTHGHTHGTVDPMITVTILRIVWDSSKAVFIRLLDGIESKIVDKIKHAVSHVTGVEDVSEVRGCWLGLLTY